MKHKREKQWMCKGNKRESVLEEVWWVVRITREAKVVGVRVWIMTTSVVDVTEVLTLSEYDIEIHHIRGKAND